MNTRSLSKNIKGILIKVITAVGLLLICFTMPHFGQRATSQAAASYLTSGKISDNFDGTDDEYFYKIAASPGTLTIGLEVAANKTRAGAILQLSDSTSKITSNMTAEPVKGGSEQVFKSVTITKKQDVIIRIKGIRYGNEAGYPGSYKIFLEGSAVTFNDLEASDVAKGDDTPTEETGQGKKPGTTQTGEGGKGKKTTKVESAIDKAKKESSKWLDLLDKVKKKP